MATAQKLKRDESLMSVLDFDAEDLDANRDGYLSKKQIARLQKDTQLTALGAGFSVIFILVVTYFIVILLLNSNPEYSRLLEDSNPFIFVFGLMGVIFLPWAMLEVGIKRHRTQRDLETGNVYAARGYVQLTMERKIWGMQVTPNDYQAVVIDDVCLPVSKKTFVLFSSGMPYCIYYVPHRKILLSAERITETESTWQQDTSLSEDYDVSIDETDSEQQQSYLG